VGEMRLGRGGALRTIARSVLVGRLILLAGTIPRSLLFAANLRYASVVPWALPVTALYIWLFWRCLSGKGRPRKTSKARQEGLRAQPLPARRWMWALLSGTLGIVALVLSFARRTA